MRRAAFAGALALAGCAGTPTPVAQDVLIEPAGVTMGTWRAVDATTGRIADVDALEQLALAFPNSGSVQLRLLTAYLGAERASDAYRQLDLLLARGYRFSSNGEQQLNAFFAAHSYRKPIEATMPAGEVIEASKLVTTLPASVRLAEGVVKERVSGRIYATSIVSRGLFRQDGRDGWERVELGQVGSLSGLIQAPDGRLWASSGVYEQTPDPATAYRGLVGYDPRNGAVSRIAAPSDATPSDLAIAAGGTLYASDPFSGAVYFARPGEGALSVLISPGVFRSPQGLSPSADGRFLYLSDYRYGLALVDLGNRRVDRLAPRHGELIDGTDGLWLLGNELVAVQNGTSPMRIAAFELSGDGREIVNVRTIERAHPQWTEPLGGSLDGDSLLYIATGRWDRFGEGGTPVGDGPEEGTEIRLVAVPERPSPPPGN